MPCPCVNAKHPHHSLHHQQELLGKGQTGPCPASKHHAYGIASHSVWEAPCTEHALPQEQANFNIYVSSRKALLHLEE